MYMHDMCTCDFHGEKLKVQITGKKSDESSSSTQVELRAGLLYQFQKGKSTVGKTTYRDTRALSSTQTVFFKDEFSLNFNKKMRTPQPVQQRATEC